MTKKMIRVTMGDGSKWDVPAEVVATDYATWHANYWCPPTLIPRHKWDERYMIEYDSIIEDEFNLLRWGENNMDWNDVAKHAVRVNPSRPADYQEGWVNGDKEVVEVES